MFCLLTERLANKYKDAATSYLSFYIYETNNVSLPSEAPDRADPAGRKLPIYTPNKHNINKSRLSHYLAGLIDGDGHLVQNMANNLLLYLVHLM